MVTRVRAAGVVRGATARRWTAIALAFAGLTSEATASDVPGAWSLEDGNLFLQAPSPDHPIAPNILGTIAIAVPPQPTSTRWSKLMSASLDQPRLARLVEHIRGLPRDLQVGFVQAAVARALRVDAAPYNCSDDGYWAPADETLARGEGDCFDVAVAKMEALRSLGMRDEDLYLTTGRVPGLTPTGRQRESVALLAYVDGHFWLLSEQSAEVVEVDDASGKALPFAPVLTYGVGATWLHGRLVKVAALGE